MVDDCISPASELVEFALPVDVVGGLCLCRQTHLAFWHIRRLGARSWILSNNQIQGRAERAARAARAARRPQAEPTNNGGTASTADGDGDGDADAAVIGPNLLSSWH